MKVVSAITNVLNVLDQVDRVPISKKKRDLISKTVNGALIGALQGATGVIGGALIGAINGYGHALIQNKAFEEGKMSASDSSETIKPHES